MAFTDWDTSWHTFSIKFPSVQSYMVNLYNAKESIPISATWTELRTRTKRCMDYIYGALNAHIGTNWLDPIDESWHYMAVYYAHGGTVDLQTINDAMREGTFQEIRDHLSLQWAFQQVMFDQPFFPDSYTALVEYLRT